MSTSGIISLKCPQCGEEFEAKSFTVVRGDRDFKLKETILSGEFDLFMCPACSGVFSHEEPFIYLDPDMEIFAFVLPEKYLEEKEKWIKKISGDYADIRDSLKKDPSFSFEQKFLFGIGSLIELLSADRDAQEETEVIEFIAKDFKMNFCRISPSFARNQSLPFSVPYLTEKPEQRASDSSGAGSNASQPEKKTCLEALKKIMSANQSLPRLKNLMKLLELLESEEISFAKNGKNISLK
ncbi:MAG: hypothetical protein HY746_00035 [Elusimicrobia bacterium]|nr:hypothetical protein [Elusimicrobiota bacterium]